MRVLVCGNRDWTDATEIAFQLARIFGLERERVVIHGGNGNLRARPPRGADVIAGFCAEGVGARVEAYPVDHTVDGPWPGAGPRRNSRMLADGEPDRGLAFGALWQRWANRGGGVTWLRTGTGDMVAKLLRARVPVRWVAEPGAVALDLVEMPGPPAVPQAPLARRLR